jgi:hypothetical protein
MASQISACPIETSRRLGIDFAKNAMFSRDKSCPAFTPNPDSSALFAVAMKSLMALVGFDG